MKIITIPKVLREKLGEDGVDALIELLNASNEKLKIDLIELQTEKYERRLTEEINKLRAEDISRLDKRITEEINKLKSEDIARLDKRITEESARLDKRITEETAKIDKRITEEISKLRVEFNEKISKTYANIIKWMFIFWVGQIGVMTIIFFTFLKFIR
ncbi:MAG: hypothetical protein ABIN73_03760 [candidate division WOR-3 bacterium]